MKFLNLENLNTKSVSKRVEKAPCAHLKGTYKEVGQMNDYINDRIIDVEKEFCNICNKEITPEMKVEIKKHLKNFK